MTCIHLLHPLHQTLAGIDGKIAVSLQPLGSGRYSHEDLLEQLDVKENRASGITHCFTVLVDEPASYKMLAQSKTYGKWKASYETCHKISEASFA